MWERQREIDRELDLEEVVKRKKVGVFLFEEEVEDAPLPELVEEQHSEQRCPECQHQHQSIWLPIPSAAAAAAATTSIPLAVIVIRSHSHHPQRNISVTLPL